MKFTVTERASRILQDGRGTLTGKEAWAARSADGRWVAERLDEPGTPWALRRVEDGRVVGTSFASLPTVVRCVTSGVADRIADQCTACGGEGVVTVELQKGEWGYAGWSGATWERRPCGCCGGDGRWKPAPLPGMTAGSCVA